MRKKAVLHYQVGVASDFFALSWSVVISLIILDLKLGDDETFCL